MTNLLPGLLLTLLGLWIEGVGGVKLLELVVPKYVDRGSSAKLICKFDTENAKLYSIKWYKDEFEFYRYMPDNTPHSQVFELEGVFLDENESGIDHVLLTKLQFSSTGSYRCEVSTEAPNFDTVFSNHNMTVLAYPRSDPILTDYQESYAIHDIVECNCTAAPSNPAPYIHWYINDLKADDYLVQRSELIRHPDNTFSMWANLKFSALRQHFLGTRGLLTLRCDADALPIDTVSTTITSHLQGVFTNQKPPQGDYRKSDGRSLTHSDLILILGVLLLAT